MITVPILPVPARVRPAKIAIGIDQKNQAKASDLETANVSDLETISINTQTFVEGAPSSLMPLQDLAEQVNSNLILSFYDFFFFHLIELFFFTRLFTLCIGDATT